ncbi:MAG: ferrochelatase [Acidimicrobiales bacterium]
MGDDRTALGEDGRAAAEAPYDALLVVSFGGPEGPDDVLPFLRNVLRGSNVPASRMDQVAEHYHLFGGVSPINDQNRALISALEAALAEAGIAMPVYWGNRNWHPLLTDTVEAMRQDGVRRALAFVTSAFGSTSGCRQYQDDIAGARAEVGDAAPVIDKIRPYYDHPDFVAAMADHLRAARDEARSEATGADGWGDEAEVVFTAHSLPMAMSAVSPYVGQLRVAASLVAEASGEPAPSWQLAYQSRSGSPAHPWLEPDVSDVLKALPEGATVVVQPLGFVSDHMEVVYDLDHVAAGVAGERGQHWVRAGTPGTHPRFISMALDLIQERLDPSRARRGLSPEGPWPDTCPAGCCEMAAEARTPSP